MFTLVLTRNVYARVLCMFSQTPNKSVNPNGGRLFIFKALIYLFILMFNTSLPPTSLVMLIL